MKNTIKRNNTIFCICLLAVLSLAILFVAALPLQPIQANAFAEEPDTEITSITSVSEPTDVLVVGSVQYKKVETAAQLNYVLRNSTADKYILMNDFTITDNAWCNDNKAAANNNSISGAIYNENNVPTGEKHSITFAPNSKGTETLSVNQYCGLFGNFSGTLSSLKFYFSGRILVRGNSFNSDSVTIYAGGVAGIFSGTISNCDISNTGSISCYGQKANRNIYVGSIAGMYSGAVIKDSAISISGSLSVANKQVTNDAENDLDATKNKMYVGGIAGYAKREGAKDCKFTNNSLLVSATISSSEVSGHNFWDSLNPFSYEEPNNEIFIYPAGGMFACADQVFITNCSDITIAGSISSIGNEQSSKKGAIAGGLIGITGSQAMININDCQITLSGSLTTRNICYVPKDILFFDAGGENTGIVYQGGIIAKIVDSINSNCKFQNIVIKKESNFVKDTLPDNSPGGDFFGMLCGYPGANDSFATWNKGNIWTVGDISDSDYRLMSDVDGNKSALYGVVHNLQVYGGGNVGVSFNESKVTFYANQVNSPFYGWYEGVSNMSANTKYVKSTEVGYDTQINSQTGEQYKVHKYTPATTHQTSVNMCLLFLTTEIYDSGNMVQFANEMNTGVPAIGETGSGVMLNFPWVEVSLMNDITFNQGMPVIRSFKGKFNGNGKTITFDAASRIVGSKKVGMFAVIEEGAKFYDTNIVFAGGIYAGNQDISALDDNTTAGVLAAENFGEVYGIRLEIAQAGSLNVFGNNSIVGGLIGINKPSGSLTNALRQVDVTIDGKISVFGISLQIGGLVGRSEVGTKYEMINVYAKGEIVGSTTDSNSCKVYIGGLFGVSNNNLVLANTVVNVREYSNYNNDVLLCSCRHNEVTYADLMMDASEIRLNSTSGWKSAAADIENILSYFGDGDDCLRVATRSKKAYDSIESKLNTLLNKIKASSINMNQAQEEYDYIYGMMVELDCSAQCPSCYGTSSAFAIAGMVSGSAGKSFSNTWVLGSYSQYPDVLNPQPADVGTSKLYYLSKSDTTKTATENYGLNLIYVRGGSSYCIMDISSISDENILFTVSVDTTKVFTGWYTTFNHSVMVSAEMLVPEGFKPGTKSGQIFYSSVIESLVSTYDMLNMIATTTNAGQTYEGTEFVLGGDIICPKSSVFVPIGTRAEPFCGTFDGKGYTIDVLADLPRNVLEVGIFGCVGVGGTVKQLKVIYRENVKGVMAGAIFGGIAAYNLGTIGQDSTSNKVSVTYKQKVDNATTAGGIVGINEGTLENAVVYYEDVDAEKYGFISAQSNGSGDIYNAAVAGGAVGINKSNALVRNTLVRSNVISIGNYTCNILANAESEDCSAYAGGVVGYNEGFVYSVVAELTYESSESSLAKFRGRNGYEGTLIGFNNGVISDLWALYSFSKKSLYAEPSKNGATYTFSLINGENSDVGNRLVKYGVGEIEVNIYANNELQPFGGTIIFRAMEGADANGAMIPFYNYTTSMTVGAEVSSADGGSGQNFSPRISNLTATGLTGCVYYAVFTRTEIRNKAEYYAFAKAINAGFSAYANYIINLTGATTLQLYANDEDFATVGIDNEFVGSFNGNGFNINLSMGTVGAGGSANECMPLFGTIARNSLIQNVNYTVYSDVELKTPYVYDNKAVLGFFANVNLGTITNLNMSTTGYIFGNNSYAGGLVGYNDGSISAVSVSFSADNVLGYSRAGTIYADYAGGIAGINSGTIGSDRLDSVKINLNSDGENRSSIYGINAVGGIVGLNKGNIKNVNSKISGKLSTAEHSNQGFYMGTNSDGENVYNNEISSYSTKIGLVAGINENSISSAIVYSYSQAMLIALGKETNGIVGGIAGKNEVFGVIGDSNQTDSIKVFFYTEIKDNAPQNFGGITAENNGSVVSSSVYINSFVQTQVYAGGICGFNKGQIRGCVVKIDGQGSVVTGYGSDISYLGGAVGRNESGVSLLNVTVLGNLGSTTLTDTVGGLVGYNAEANLVDSFVVLSTMLNAKNKKGLVAGYSVDQSSSPSNVWAVAVNSDTTKACNDGNRGFNVLKIVGTAYVKAEFVVSQSESPTIKFTAPYISGMKMIWYKDISLLDSFSSTANTYIAGKELFNCVYHVCYFDLEIDTAQEFTNIYQYVNAYDFFHGVMFRLNNNITVETTLQPIGTSEHPFNGIFEGDYHTILFKKGGIAGSAYSGIFGYVADNAVISNFVVDIDEGIIVGSGMSDSAGVLAGRLGGTVKNVAINLYSAPYSLKENAKVGALAGTLSDNYRFESVWVVIYNSAVQAIGAMESGDETTGLETGLNEIAVLGLGRLSVSFPIYEVGEFMFTVTEGFDYYNDWYYDISTHETILGKHDSATYGIVDDRVESNIITYQSRVTLKDKKYTISFIDLQITSAESFIRFAQNINKYGAGGAKFTMNLGKDANNNDITEIVVDMSICPPIGTAAHPFTGIFDGTVDLNTTLDSLCYTIRVVGNLSSEANEYTGLFGYVGTNAVISNLIVRADNVDENPDYQGQKFGDKRSIYTGYLASYLQGSLKNVVVILGDETEVYNINSDSYGGLVGVMGEGAQCINSWLVLPENSQYRVIGGYKNAEGEILSYGEGFAESHAGVKIPNLLYRCGSGLLDISLIKSDRLLPTAVENLSWDFSLTTITGGEQAYGFIDNTVYEPEKHERFYSAYNDNYFGEEYLALFLDPVIDEYSDLVKLAELTNSGRSYIGIEFSQAKDIILEQGYVPIGGQVQITGSSSIGAEYKLVEFIGAYNGNGYKIIIPANVTINSPYAGIFGILGKEARISDLFVQVIGTVGVVSDVYSDSTVYAGTVAALDYGASLKNIIVVLDKAATLNATVDTGRVAVNSQLVYDVHGVITNMADITPAQNVWVLVYNNKYNNGRNATEQAFFDGNGGTRLGKYNGGINVLTVIAAGNIEIEFNTAEQTINGVRIYNPDSSVNQVLEWYTIENGEKNDYVGADDEFFPNYDTNSLLLYASFLNSEISSVSDLKKLANDTNKGYDLYGLTYEITSDIVIQDDDYVSLGGDSPFNAILDGNGYTITLKEGVIVKGKYAGIVGNLGTDGVVKDIILCINGQLGYNKYTEREVSEGKLNTEYAGAVAYIQGKLDSVIIIGTTAKVDGNEDNSGIAFGYDVKSLLTNVWLITNAENSTAPFGTTAAASGESTINVMRVIGMGTLDVGFIGESGSRLVYMKNHEANPEDISRYAVKGWYSNYAKDNQLSEALGVHANGTNITSGDQGKYIALASLINRRYEVVIINTVIKTVEQLISIANDVNIGGYSFENTSFALGSNLEITQSNFVSIGNETTPFMGSFSGSYNGSYYSITLGMYTQNPDLTKNDCSVPLFGYNSGVITDLSVIVSRTIDMPNSVVGIVARYNYGTISNTLVNFIKDRDFIITGSTVGGLVGYNAQDAVVENCIVIIPEKVTLRAKFIAGGLVGDNYGKVTGSTGGSNSEFSDWNNNRIDLLDNITEFANVILSGEIHSEINDNSTTLYSGGAVGISQNLGNINKLVVRINSTGIVSAKGPDIAVGGIIGRSSATIRNSVIITEGRVEGVGNTVNIGHYVGNIQGSATNSWMVTSISPKRNSIGNGYESVNVLEISGNGVIDVYIDEDNNIIFTNITSEEGASLDGWYVNNGVAVTDSIGNVDEKTFRPNSNITGRTVNVVFINTEINDLNDLITMAQTVNGGLFAKQLTFTLQNDITIDSNNRLTACVGIYTEDGAYGFKHIFNGNNKTITIESAEEVCSMEIQSFMGIFGYTTSSAEIKNLNVIYKNGTYGDFSTIAFGGISSYNAGVISDCKVYIGTKPDNNSNGSSATLKAQNVGGIVGVNMRSGVINNCFVENYGTLYAESKVAADNTSPNAYAGGVTGSNAGTINSVSVHLLPISGNSVQAVYISPSAGATYVGGISGSNSGTVNIAYVEMKNASVKATSQISAYAGGLVGSNIGTVQNAYIDIGDGSVIKGTKGLEDVSGGIAGINSYFLKNIVVKITSANIVSDSAIGQFRAMTSTANNVWVYNNSSNLNSEVGNINNMTFFLMEGNIPSVSHNDYHDIIKEDGQIIFYSVLQPTTGITMYADAHTDFKDVLYNKSYINYQNNMLVLTSPEDAQSICLKAVIRRNFNSQTEIKMLAMALASGVQDVVGSFTIEQDIVITDDYLAIGTPEHPFNATFNASYNRITFDVSGEEKTPVTYLSNLKGLFGINAGLLKNLNVYYNYSLTDDNSAGICVTNTGTISDSVVYSAQDVKLNSPIAKGDSFNNSNLWHIARVGSDGSLSLGSTNSSNSFSAIVVHGNGDINIVKDSAVLTFTAVCRNEGTLFAGFSDIDEIKFKTNFVTNSETVTALGCNFSAVFISSVIAARSDLLALVDALTKGYGALSVNETYTLANDDVVVTEQEINGISEFNGTFDGKDHILKIISGDTEQDDYVFLSPDNGGATYRDITFDLRGLDEGIFLFDNGYKLKLNNVSIIDTRKDARLYNDQSLSPKMNTNNTFIVTNNAETIADLSYQTPGVGYIFMGGEIDITFQSDAAHYRAVAHASQSEIFVGWYNETDGESIFVDDVSATLLLTNANNYRAHFISTNVQTAEDIITIQKAVENGFEFKDNAFEIVSNITVSLDSPIGEYYVFSGIINGNGNTLTINGACPLFDTFGGQLKNTLIFTANATAIANSLRTESILENVAVHSSAQNATIAGSASGTLTNTWLVSSAPVTVGTLNTLAVDVQKLTAGISFEDGIKISIVTLNSDELIKWYKEDAVLFNDKYGYVQYTDASGIALRVTSISQLSEPEDITVLSLAVKTGYNQNISLSKDLVLDETYSPVIGFTGRFNGNGHTITISNLSKDFVLFDGTVGAVSNLKLCASSEQSVSVAISNASDELSSVNNCVIELGGNTTPAFNGIINNLWIVCSLGKTAQYTQFTEQYSSLGAVNILGINQGLIDSSITESGVISFAVADNQELSFLGYTWGERSQTLGEYTAQSNATGVRLMAFFVSNTISSVEDWNILSNALFTTENSANGMVFTLENDMEITEEFKRINSFDGTLDGNFNSIILNGGKTNFEGIIITTENGVIRNLAVEVYSKSDFKEGYTSVLPNGIGVINCWVIDYVGGITAGQARVISVNNMESKPANGGIISVNSNDGAYNFISNDLPEYKLRYWQTDSDEILALINGKYYYSNSLDNGKVVDSSIVCDNAVIKAVFFSCYTVTVEIRGIDNSAVKPNVSKTQTYWSDDTQPKTVEAKSTTGYIFWGFTYDETVSAITKEGDLKLSIDISALSSSVTIYADYSLIETEWTTVTYGEIATDKMKDYLSISSDQKARIEGLDLVITTLCLPEGDTLNTVEGMPYHAGNYSVKFWIKKTSDVGGNIVTTTFGEAVFGFTILPRVLQFSELTLNEKAYDTTDVGTIATRKLFGFIPEDKSDEKIATLDFSHVKFSYYDPNTQSATANAGSGYYVTVHPNSYLDSKSDSVFFHIDYTLPSGIIYRYSEKSDGTAEKLEPYTFGIEKADLTLTIKTITVNYLDQFKPNEKDKNKFFDINEKFKDCYEFTGIMGNDIETINNTKLLVIDGDSIEYGENGSVNYVYHIKKPGDYAISTLTDALVNYNPKISGASARFRVIATPVEVTLDNMEIQYGYFPDKLSYHFSEIIKEVKQNPFSITEQEFELLAQEFEITQDYKSFIDEYLSINLSTERVFENDSANAVIYPIPSEDYKYGVVYRFLSSNSNFTLSDKNAETVYTNSKKEYIITQDLVLKILPRDISVEYTGAAGKSFASTDADFSLSAKAVGTKSVSGDSISVYREHAGEKAYEMVGSYPLSFVIKNSAGDDITAYYNLSYANGVGYNYSINKRIVKISHTGYNYYYGDVNAISNMPYSSNISNDVKTRIIEILRTDEKHTSLESVGIKIKVGYFEQALLNVGKYTCTLNPELSELASSCLEIVADSSSFSYSIVPAKLTIITNNIERNYNKSNLLSFPEDFKQLTVSGFVSDHNKYLFVSSNEYKGDIKASAGTYYYRPDLCVLQTISKDYDYLLNNYTIDKISDGKYTIKPLQISVKADVGFYEDGKFVSKSNIIYFGDKRAAYKFTATAELTGYLKELYDSEITEESTDKEKSDWLEEMLQLKFVKLSDINVIGLVKAEADTKNTSILLHSSDNNIKITPSGAFTIIEVRYVVEVKEIKVLSGTDKPMLNGSVKVYDGDQEIEGYQINSQIVDLPAGESYDLSNGVSVKFDVIEYSDNTCKYNLSTLINKQGTLVAPQEEMLYIKEEDNREVLGNGENPLSSEVTVEYTSWEKLMAFITGSPILFASMLAGVLLVIAGICFISALIHHNKKIAKAALREQLNEHILEKNDISMPSYEDLEDKSKKY